MSLQSRTKGAEDLSMDRTGGARQKGPPEELHVYYLNGVLPTDEEEALGPDFLGNWVEGEESFLFFKAPSDSRVRNVMAGYANLKVLDAYRFSYEEWQGANVDRFRTGPFEVCPAWQEEGSGSESGVRILLDPGVVFGSGIHPTTQDCLRALAWIWERDAPRILLDLGTGTGILAIAGVLLGAEKAVGVDVNPLCIRTARQNLRWNDVESSVRLVEGNAEHALAETADVVVANLHYDVIAALMQRKAFFRRRWLVVSGLMRTQAAEIRSRMSERGMRIVWERDRDMVWYTMVARPSD